jgi:programmed cell death protein 5
MSSHLPDESNEQSVEQDAQLAAQKELILKQILSSDARLRLNNVRLVKPDLSNLVENYLINMASQGKFNSQISDEQLKQILMSMQQPKRDFKINRK